MKLYKPTGGFKRIYLSGASFGLLEAARILNDWKLPVRLLTAPRYLGYQVNDGSLLTERLQSLKVDLRVFNSLKEMEGKSTQWNLTDCVLLSYGAPFIFREDFLGRFGGHAFNFHPSPLPKFRGGGGYSWRILSGNLQGCISVHQLTSGIDDGLLALTTNFKFPKTARLPIHFERFESKKSIELTRTFLKSLLIKRFISLKPQHGNASYFPRLFTPINGAIDWSWKASHVERFIRAFSHPYPGSFTHAYTKSGRSAVRVFDAQAGSGHTHPYMAGLVLDASKEAFTVACGTGTVRIKSSNLMCEIPLTVGDRLLTDPSDLMRAKAVRVSYGPQGLKLTPPVEQ
jgi:methionyl-tRNA formyltransferase